jgi:TrmH family RNA methyltransferase
MPTITSRQNPVVARYRAAARRDDDDVVLLDGAHLVAEALAARVRIEHATISAAAREDPDLQRLRGALDRVNVEVAVAAAPVMDAISPVRSPSAIVALATRPVGQIDALFADTDTLIVAAVNVQDPGNAGAIVRVAEAGGATGVMACGTTADPFGWKALRGSMGSALRLPIVRAVEPLKAVAIARERGCRIVATAPRGGRSLFDLDLTGPLLMLVGGEGAGLAPPLVDAADDRVTIPMQAPVESLNAAVTAGLIVYEARRQRGGR